MALARLVPTEKSPELMVEASLGATKEGGLMEVSERSAVDLSERAMAWLLPLSATEELVARVGGPFDHFVASLWIVEYDADC